MSVEKKTAREPCCSKLKVILIYLLLLFSFLFTLAHYDQRHERDNSSFNPITMQLLSIDFLCIVSAHLLRSCLYSGLKNNLDI